MKKFPINFITNLSSNTETRNLILEIRSEERIATLTEYGFSSLQIDKIRTNLTLDTEKQKKTIIFSHISDAYDTITCFFPSVSLMDDRTGLFSSLKQSSVFFPEGDELEALEALTLATYSYDTYLSKPSTIRHSLLISEDNMEHVESKIQLLNAILWARDMINMPAKDANPIGIVTAIQAYPWKQFNVEVFDKAELQKLGCNLLLAVSAGSDIPPYMVVIRPKSPVA